MFARLLAAREKEEGFTLIELLVVIIIIGILAVPRRDRLAAIAIPVFLNQRAKGWDSAVKADLRNAATAQETWLTDTGVYNDNSPVSDATVAADADPVELGDVGVLQLTSSYSRPATTPTASLRSSVVADTNHELHIVGRFCLRDCFELLEPRPDCQRRLTAP
jgi:prepilin-type N-terminal cleavage/methylation domain-containing protein